MKILLAGAILLALNVTYAQRVRENVKVKTGSYEAQPVKADQGQGKGKQKKR